MAYRKPFSPLDLSSDEHASSLAPMGKLQSRQCRVGGPLERGASLCGVQVPALRPDPEAQSRAALWLSDFQSRRQLHTIHKLLREKIRKLLLLWAQDHGR